MIYKVRPMGDALYCWRVVHPNYLGNDYSSTDENEGKTRDDWLVIICPRCDSINIRSTSEHTWYCIACQLVFEHECPRCPLCNHHTISYEKDNQLAICHRCGTTWSNLSDLTEQINMEVE